MDKPTSKQTNESSTQLGKSYAWLQYKMDKTKLRRHVIIIKTIIDRGSYNSTDD